MIKVNSILIVLLFAIPIFASNGYCQNKAIITYTYKSYGGFEKDLLLLINDGKSRFIYHKDNSTVTTPDGYEYYHHFTHYENYFDFRTKKIVETRTLPDSTKLIAQWDLDLNWKITDETKEIAGYKVQKAIVQSYDTEGREEWDYGDAIAWFAIDIPFGTGPERYYGLPGLIVQLEFSKRSMKYTLKSINYNAGINKISMPTSGVTVKKEQIIRPKLLDKKWLKNARELLNSEN